MRTKIIKVGNSTGICIPKIILEQCHFEDFVDVQILEDKLIITPVNDEAKKRLKEEAELLSEEMCWYEDESEWK